MKLKSLFTVVCATLALAASASAQTVINITGATAFRQAAHEAIRASLDAGYTFGYQGTNIGNAGRAIFNGTINGGADAVIVRTSWSGSVAGIAAIVNSTSVTYFADTAGNIALLSGGTGTPSFAGTTESETTANKIAFADNTQDNTPYDAVGLEGGPIGVAAFIAVANEHPNIAQGDNITTLKLRRLMQAGSAPLQFVTGDAADATIRAYWTGRRDTSGTRVIYMTNAGLAASTPIQQYRVSPTTQVSNIAITELQLWPTGDTANASIVWGPDTAGNGGYNSGGDLVPLFTRTSNSGVTVRGAAGNIVASNQNVALITVISSQEGQLVQDGQGRVLSFEGSYIEPENVDANNVGGLSATDQAKIANGQYTLWSNEQLFNRDDINDVERALVDLLFSNVPTRISGNGVALTAMNVSRQADGGSLTVKPSLP